MSFRKNAFSYSVWMIFIMCNCIVFSFLSMLCAKIVPAPLPVVALGLTAAFFGLLFLLYLLTGFVSRSFASKSINNANKKSIKSRLIWEGIVTVCILAVGVVVRIYMLPAAGEAAAYFDVAKVTQDSTELMIPVQNSIYYYICLLHGMFMLLGNHWIAGIWLQIILQVLGSIVLYFLIRKMAGVCVAILTLAFMMFSASSVQEGLNYSPQMLYFLIWSLNLLFVVLYLDGSTKDREKETRSYSLIRWGGALLLGILVGFLAYVDVSGAVLLIPFLFLPRVRRGSKSSGVWIGRMLLAIAAAVAGFFGFIYMDGMLSDSSFYRVLNAWLVTYQPELPNMVVLLQTSTLEVVILLVLMAINVFAFLRRKDGEITTPWILMTFAMAALYVMGITTTSMNGRNLLLVLMSVVAAIGIRELFYVNLVAENVVTKDELKIMEMDDSAPQAQEGTLAGVMVSNGMPVEKPRLLDNPLPLPKKHVKKVMDYAFVPEAVQMKYDVNVADTDDFDI